MQKITCPYTWPLPITLPFMTFFSQKWYFLSFQTSTFWAFRLGRVPCISYNRSQAHCCASGRDVLGRNSFPKLQSSTACSSFMTDCNSEKARPSPFAILKGAGELLFVRNTRSAPVQKTRKFFRGIPRTSNSEVSAITLFFEKVLCLLNRLKRIFRTLKRILQLFA